MIEVNSVNTNIPISRSALPDDITVDNIGANLVAFTATDSINAAKSLPVTVTEGAAYSNYFYISTGNTFANLSTNEAKYYYLIVFKKDNPLEILYSVPVRWCGRINAAIKSSAHFSNNYLDIKYNTKYFEG